MIAIIVSLVLLLIVFLFVRPFVIRKDESYTHSWYARTIGFIFGFLVPTSLAFFLFYSFFSLVIRGEWWWTEEGANVSYLLQKLMPLVFFSLFLGALVFSWKRNRSFAWGLLLGILPGSLFLFRAFNLAALFD